MEHEVNEEEIRQKSEILHKREQIDQAERKKNETVSDSKLVEEIFDIFDDDGNEAQSEGPYPFMDLEEKRRRMISENGLDLDEMAIPLPDDEEDLSEYKFSKFAAMYFKNNATHSYIRRVLREPLLPLASDGDKLAALAVWITSYDLWEIYQNPNTTRQWLKQRTQHQ